MITPRWIPPVALVMVAAFAAGCGAPQGPRAVRIEAGEEMMPWSPLPAFVAVHADSEPQGLLVFDGDLLLGDSTMIVQYRAGDGPLLRLSSTPWSTSLAGKVVTIAFESAEAWRWLENASREDLAGLRTVAVPESLDRAQRAAFRRLGDVNPGVGLLLASDSSLVAVLPSFRPRWLMLGIETSHGLAATSSLRDVEFLAIAPTDSGSLDILHRIPKLRRLAIGEWDLETAGALPAGLDGLRSVSAWEVDGMKDLSPLREAPAGLEELTLGAMEEPLDLSGLAQFPALTKLVLTGSEMSSDVSHLAGLRKLRWLGVPKHLSQGQFAELIRMHPGLRTLEVIEPDSVIDLAPLRGLTKLEGVLLSGKFEHLEALNGLRSLRYVGLAGESDSARVVLRKALPDALVVPIAPYNVCLGSGWMLLILPLAAGAWLLGARRRGRTRGGAHVA